MVDRYAVVKTIGGIDRVMATTRRYSGAVHVADAIALDSRDNARRKTPKGGRVITGRSYDSADGTTIVIADANWSIVHSVTVSIVRIA